MDKERSGTLWHKAAMLAPPLGALVICGLFFLLPDRPGPLAVWVALTGLCVALLCFLFERHAIRRLNLEKELLRRSEASYAMASALSSEVLFRYDCASCSLSFNRSLPGADRLPAPPLSYGALLADPDFASGKNRDALQNLALAVQSGVSQGTAEFCFTHREATPLWQRVDYRVVRDGSGTPTEVVGKLTDVTEQKRLLETLLQKADSDPLTNLLNRSAMAARTEAFLCGEGKGGFHAFLMVDVDDFKRTNDTLGHPMGDRLLVAFAAQVLRLFRADDLVCRMGGDEFSVLIKNVRDRSHVAAKAREICTCLESVNRALSSAVTASVGVALYPGDGESFNSLYEKADQALYRAKRLGKSQVAFFAGDGEQS